MARGPGRPTGEEVSPVDQAVAWFRENGVESTLSACCNAIGVGMSTAARARAKLKEAKELPESFSPHDPGAGEHVERTASRPPPAAASSPRPRSSPQLSADTLSTMDQALERVLSGAVETMTPDQALQYASELVRIAPTFQLKLSALRELNKLRSDSSAKEDLGPGPPRTREDRLVRATWILQACGRVLAGEVWTKAFNEVIAEVHAVETPVLAISGLDEALPS